MRERASSMSHLHSTLLPSNMSLTTTPDYSITQTATHIHIHVVAPSPAPSSAARAIAQGTTFGLVWGDAYLPLVLPAAASVAPGVDPVCQTDAGAVTVILQKEKQGFVQGLDQLQPQILPDAPEAPGAAATQGEQADGAASGMLDAALGRENERRVERGEGRIVPVQDSAATRDGDEPAIAEGECSPFSAAGFSPAMPSSSSY